MKQDESARRLAGAVEEFNRHENRNDGEHVLRNLSGGLTLLRQSLYLRVHDDVGRMVSTDSMWEPASEMKSRLLARMEIDLYQIVESAAAARESGYVGTTDDWYLQWLARLRLGESHADPKNAKRLADYLSKTPDDRRLAFTDVLVNVLPKSRQAPLVLFRLLPLAVHIVTAQAFDDQLRASQLRDEQVDCLPAIRDCHECHGEVFHCGEQCPQCGNPLWKPEWLAAD